MRSRRAVIAVIAAVVAFVAVGAAVVLWPRATDVVTQEDAVAAYRDRVDVATPTDEAPDGIPVPAPGVYSYAATGSEDVKVAVLPSEHRPYPDLVTTTVVVDKEPGCFTMTLSLLAEHTEDTTYCSDADGTLRIGDHRKRQRVGALDPVADMTCRDDVLIAADGDGTELRCDLHLDAGPTSLSASLAGTSTVGAGSVVVDGTPVPASVLEVTYEISGDLSGTWREVLWLADDTRLPVRIERQLDLSGLATFSESSDLRLLDLAPAR